jgi:hypothetical protein
MFAGQILMGGVWGVFAACRIWSSPHAGTARPTEPGGAVASCGHRLVLSKDSVIPYALKIVPGGRDVSRSRRARYSSGNGAEAVSHPSIEPRS